ncbi:hypothetical protein TSOC_014718 [Tetrabaena socialis]|uniref:Glycosyltransferase family 92 protein n=1 Tax=Tetrabaena socialis TaxID=47790 RepID=A0A2J7ZGV8_9CHLO|nr:hypothetical protein TSOC_014718 [Tetrabaena socialis]|eukprot:PNG99496.1 hypothetical protein TSOC_014718 [Tetrabaena socialis]
MSKSLVKIIVLTRNEYDLIEDFLTFYGFVFGVENIVLVDNGSDDPRVWEVYRKYHASGLTVIHEPARNMLAMASIVTAACTLYKDSCDFLLPLDTDEFMFLPAAPHISGSEFRDCILRHLRDLPKDVSVLKYGKFFGSIPDASSHDYVGYKHQRPARSIMTFYDQAWDKVIVRAPVFRSVSQGNHAAVVDSGRTDVSAVLGLLHFHETGMARQRERCIMSILGYRMFDPHGMNLDEQLRACDIVADKHMCGGHRVKQYRTLLRREMICREFKRLLLRLPSLNEMLRLTDHENAWRGPSALPTCILATSTLFYKATKPEEASAENLIHVEVPSAVTPIVVEQVSRVLTDLIG